MHLYFQVNGNLLPLFYQAAAEVAESSGYIHRSKHYFPADGIGGTWTYWMQSNFASPPEAIAPLLTEYISRLE